MKIKWMRAGALALAAAAVFSLAACKGDPRNTEGGSSEINLDEAAPKYEPAADQAEVKGFLTERPCYVLPENATEEDFRNMAIKAMYDELTFKWSPSANFTYGKTVNGNMKNFNFYSRIVYAGLPYTEAALGIFHALELYDYSNGILYGASDFKAANKEIGNSCAASVNWAECSVCPSLSAVSTSDLTSAYGYDLVGSYKIPDGLRSFQKGGVTTQQVVEDNGLQVIYEALALTKPADALVSVGSSAGGDHVEMIYKAPEVVRNADGTIDPLNSKLWIIDQWASEEEVETDGVSASMRGRVNVEQTFEYLGRHHFLPVTPKDFKNPYVKAEAKMDREVTSLEDMKKAKVLTNYRTVKIETAVISEAGNVIYTKKDVTDRSLYPNKQDRAMNSRTIVPGKDALDVMKDGKTYTLRIRALVSTGELLTAAEFPVTTADFQ